jgi:hypothetical protein
MERTIDDKTRIRYDEKVVSGPISVCVALRLISE